MASPSDSDPLREALKTVAVRLKQADVPYALAGGYAAWARGGPEPDHDVDFVVAAVDIDQAKAALSGDGLRVEQPPEDWLFKVYVDDAMVDVIHHFGAFALERSMFEDCDELEVLSVCMPVMTATQVVWSKLRALDEHSSDFGAQLPTLRALREQVDWADVEERVGDNDFAAALLFLGRRLEIVPKTEKRVSRG